MRSPPAWRRSACPSGRTSLAAQQAAASVGQGLLVHRYTEELARHGVIAGQVLLTVDDVTRRSHYRNAYQTFAKLLELGVLPIVNENDTVATSEIRFGDNDRLAALVTHLVHADLLVLLSDVDGLYDADPQRPGQLAAARGGRRSPTSAGVRIGKTGAAGARHRRDADQDRRRPDRHRRRHPRRAHLCRPGRGRARGRAGRHPLPRHRPPPPDPAAVAGPRHRAQGHPRARRGRGRVRSSSAGRRCSPPASPASTGTFVAGDPVDIVGPDGVTVARGLVNFDAEELPNLLGRSSKELKSDARRGLRARGRAHRRPRAPVTSYR